LRNNIRAAQGATGFENRVHASGLAEQIFLFNVHPQNLGASSARL
jgi:hypothetical protein